MAQTKGSLKAGLTLTVVRKASRNKSLTTIWISMELEKMTAFLKACLKSKVSLTVWMKGGPTEAVSPLKG
jgi:hypothetical protein